MNNMAVMAVMAAPGWILQALYKGPYNGATERRFIPFLDLAKTGAKSSKRPCVVTRVPTYSIWNW
jgi:hypothetical protein